MPARLLTTSEGVKTWSSSSRFLLPLRSQLYAMYAGVAENLA